MPNPEYLSPEGRFDTKKFDGKVDEFLEGLWSFLEFGRRPILTIKQLRSIDQRITYRKINDWGNRQIMVADRKENPSGWRRFSFFQATALLIIADLKSLGVEASIIKRVLTKLSDKSWRKPLPPEKSFSAFELLVFESNLGINESFSFDFSGNLLRDFPANVYRNLLAGERDYGMFVHVPLYEYAHRVGESIGLKMVKSKQSVKWLLDPSKRVIFDLLDDPNIERIEVTKDRGKPKSVVSITRKATGVDASEFLNALESVGTGRVTVFKKDNRVTQMTIELRSSLK